MNPIRQSFFAAGVVLVLASSIPAQEKPASQPGALARVCVAQVSNFSLSLVMEERLTDRLVSSLKKNRLDVVAMASVTIKRPKLRLTKENSEESNNKDCSHILLTQVVDPRSFSYNQQDPSIPIGSRIPSLDASDKEPTNRSNLQISFALYRSDRSKPLLDANFLEEPSQNGIDSFLSAMDRVANRATHELEKK